MVDSKMNEIYYINADFHTHILPGIDDGSPDLQVTEAMLRLEAEQGIRTVIATPHFYASQMTVKSFLSRREQAFRKVENLLAEKSGLPRVIPAAEVFFFPGIGKADLSGLCAGSSKVLFLEMPFRQWTEEDLREVRELAAVRKFDVVLVHIERFLPYQKKKEVLKDILNLPVTLQFNAGCLLHFGGKRTVHHILSFGHATIMGSDCHSMGRRKPDMEEGRRVLEAKFGKEAVSHLAQDSAKLLGRILGQEKRGGQD